MFCTLGLLWRRKAVCSTKWHSSSSLSSSCLQSASGSHKTWNDIPISLPLQRKPTPPLASSDVTSITFPHNKERTAHMRSLRWEDQYWNDSVGTLSPITVVIWRKWSKSNFVLLASSLENTEQKSVDGSWIIWDLNLWSLQDWCCDLHLAFCSEWLRGQYQPYQLLTSKSHKEQQTMY